MDARVNPFRLRQTEESVPSDPEQLFQSLRQTVVESLWAHQADMLRAYKQEIDRTDVALELPTGSGKTLVGLLIGEYRRRAHGDRVLYLCPTRQLAHQVGSLATSYGVSTRVLVGPGKDYPPADFAEYELGRTIAVSTYNGMFNANPRLSDAKTLLFDDAHAAAGPIADFWTVRIPRQDDLYSALLSVLDAPPHVRSLTRSRSPNYQMVEVLPPPTAETADAVSSLLDRAELDSVMWPWLNLRGHLDACQIYMSWPAIEIRPVIPPTQSFPPFARAQHRVYMSATLGEGGELERIFGVGPIARVHAPAWEGSGRRLILFPDYSLAEERAQDVSLGILRAYPRSLVLCPDEHTASNVRSMLEAAAPGHTILRASDVETTLDPFSRSSSATLVLAGRFDGLDLPGDNCRISALVGLPAATDLQERFLWSRLGGHAVLRDRILTRIGQASGRCTRSPKDYAVLMFLGHELFSFLARSENQDCLNADLRAEIEFGLMHSSADNPHSLRSLVDAFLGDPEIRSQVDGDITSRRRKLQRRRDPAAAALQEQATNELRYIYAMWNHDHLVAVEHARAVADQLSGEDLASYRSWWHYLGASAALAGGASDLAHKQLQVAARIAPALTWLKGLVPATRAEQGVGDPVLAHAAESLCKLMVTVGHYGPKFASARTSLQGRLSTNEPRPFELGLTELGRWLGFQASHPDGPGAPDSVWWISESIQLAFEAKTDEDSASAIGVNDARQAAGHLEWLDANLPVAGDDVRRAAVLISPRKRLATEAQAHARDCYYLHIDEFRALAFRVMDVVSAIRANATGDLGRDAGIVAHRLVMEQLDPAHVLGAVCRTPLRTLPTQ